MNKKKNRTKKAINVETGEKTQAVYVYKKKEYLQIVV